MESEEFRELRTTQLRLKHITATRQRLNALEAWAARASAQRLKRRTVPQDRSPHRGSLSPISRLRAKGLPQGRLPRSNHDTCLANQGRTHKPALSAPVLTSHEHKLMLISPSLHIIAPLRLADA